MLSACSYNKYNLEKRMAGRNRAFNAKIPGILRMAGRNHPGNMVLI